MFAVVLAQAIPTVQFSRFVGFSSINEAFGTALRWGVFLGLILMGLLATFGGIMYITAGADAKRASAGRSAVGNAAIGFLIIVSVYLILKVLTLIIPGLSNILIV